MPEPTASPTASLDPTPTPTAEPTASPSPTLEPTASPDPTLEPTAEPTASPGPTPTAEPTASPSPTLESTVSPSLTHKASPTHTAVTNPSAVPAATESPEDKDNGSKKLTAPTFTLKKGYTSKGAKCIKITLKKYKGRYVQLFLYKENKKIRIKISSNDIKKNKRVFRLTYSGKNTTYVFIIRTYKVVKDRKIYSSYSKKKKIRV